jgi:hypothetical protein
MKAHLSLSMTQYIPGATLTTMETWMGIVESITLMRVVRPARDISLPFQDGSRSAAVSTKGCRSDMQSLWTDRGIPKYLHGKWTN